MSRYWIVVGDRTSGDGEVLTGSPCTDIDGRAVARVGDKATCRRHGGIVDILDGDACTLIDGRPVAWEGSKLSCGCEALSHRQTLVHSAAATASSTAQETQTAGSAGGNRASTLPAAPLQNSSQAAICLECLLKSAQANAPYVLRR